MPSRMNKSQLTLETWLQSLRELSGRVGGRVLVDWIVSWSSRVITFCTLITEQVLSRTTLFSKHFQEESKWIMFSAFHPSFSWWTNDNVGELNCVFCFCSVDLLWHYCFFSCIGSLPSVSRNAGRYLLWISYQYKSTTSITKAVVLLAHENYSCLTYSVIGREWLRGVRLLTKWRPLLCVFQVNV